MLIRSQDKLQLTSVDAGYLSADYRNKRDLIFCGAGGRDENYIIIGKYSSEDKAIKVLDEIQCQYARFSCRYGSDCSDDAVYNMPQDSEVYRMNKPCEHCDKADKRESYYKCDKPCNQAKQCYENDRKLLDVFRGFMPQDSEV